ncbi:MAG: LysE family translocator [Pseudomonadota bacterium]
MEFETWLKLVVLFGAGGLTPGPAVMLVMASSFRYGFRPAMLAAFGIAAANVLWLILAASGTGALLEAFPAVTLTLKILGMLVILYLALSVMFGPLPDMSVGQDDAPRRSRLFAKGLGLQISSPMPLVYFGILLPVFFDPGKPIITQFLIMLITVTVTEICGLAVYAAFSQWIRRKLQDPRAAKAFNWIIGAVMIASGAWAILG